MIFVTVGTQLPFDRLICAIDEIAPYLDIERIIAQTNGGRYVAKNIECKRYFSAVEFNVLINQSRLILSHAGIGSIISAMTHEKPIIIMPRRASLGEHRNEHQLATARKMDELNFVNVVYNEQQLQDFILNKNIQSLHVLGGHASNRLIQSIADFIADK